MPSDIRNLESLRALRVERHVTPTSSGSTVISYTKDLGEGPVLWLVHGYPQSAYMYAHAFCHVFIVLLIVSSSWRHVILSNGSLVPLFFLTRSSDYPPTAGQDILVRSRGACSHPPLPPHLSDHY